MYLILMKHEELKSHENVIQNLQYIERSLLNNTYKEQSAILSLIVAETFELIRNMKVFYEVPYSSGNHTNHFYTFSLMAKQEKSKLLADMEEVQRELSIKNTNVKRVLVLIKGMLETNLYKDHVQASLDKWKNTTNFTTKYQLIYV
ncbi:hypothetical protein [Cytobacillus firmus]|uniref:hypothetical protein n=1 Tax=Cytobacillus firmus TaxID=1399 RepID=UPI001CFC477E|nr:hypothetical protein [Cytobacillus firmus]